MGYSLDDYEDFVKPVETHLMLEKHETIEDLEQAIEAFYEEIEFLGDFEVDAEPVYENYQPNNVDVDGVQIPTVPLEVEVEDGRGELEGNRETGRNEIADRIEAYLSEKK